MPRMLIGATLLPVNPCPLNTGDTKETALTGPCLECLMVRAQSWYDRFPRGTFIHGLKHPLSIIIITPDWN